MNVLISIISREYTTGVRFMCTEREQKNRIEKKTIFFRSGSDNQSSGSIR